MARKVADPMKVPVDVLILSDFRGLMTNADPHDLPPGAAIKQVNATSFRDGELRCRGGCKELSFED